MAQLIIPGAAQVAIKMECSGQEVVNVIGLGLAGPIGANQIAVIVRDAWEKASGPLKVRPPALKMVSYRVTKLDAGGTVAELASTTTGAGSSTALSTMASSALVMIGGGTRDRSTRGRLYHGPLAEASINDDGRTINPTFAATLTSAYTAFRNDITAAGMSWSVISRKNSTVYPIDAISVASVIATQRRRLR